MTTFTSINPATGETIETFTAHSSAQIGQRLEQGHAAFQEWRRVPMSDRVDAIRRLGKVIEKNRERYARLITAEMGKPITEARAEVEKCEWLCRYYADNGPGFLADQIVETDFQKSFVTFQPIGLLFAIMPWNFPFWQALRPAVPAILAGNGFVLKHAPNVFGSAREMEALFLEAGFPKGLFTSLYVDHEAVPDIIAHDAVQAVTLTGSVRAGKAIATLAGANLKKSVMELGGSDPFVILEDADLDKAAEAGAQSRLFNTGQTCVAAKRFIVVDPVADGFTERLVARMQTRKQGDPLDETTALGTLARADLRQNLQAQVERTLESGASRAAGGDIPNGQGIFYPATVLTGVEPGMPAFTEELFGPVASIIRVKNEDEALQVANSTSYGLGAAVFTEDLDRGMRIAKSGLDAGACFVNDFVKSDVRLPFGGTKNSGYGRELSEYGIREFVNIKTVAVG
ncbi:MAG: NAD-dependent succinate-semialdehyde dehydrogenase [Alphaproteobacteria bacterium]